MSAIWDVNADEPVSVLAPDGSLTEGYVPALDDDALLGIWRAMLLSRTFDERAFSLQRQGRLGTFSTVNGEEAAVIGTAWALDPHATGWCRSTASCPRCCTWATRCTRRCSTSAGIRQGNHMPEGVNVLPYQISLAAQIPQAVGLAWGLRHQGSDGVVAVYFGDGASSEGDAHEAMNLAGVGARP
jgi:pyruvate dehydrogenase E1 component alpha subunit